MAYSSTNPVKTILPIAFSSTAGGSLHMYESSHASTDITATSFFAGCGFASPTTAAVGMRVGDILLNVNNQTNALTWHRVTSITTSTGWHSAIHATVAGGSS